ncbi:MAG: hypothetical protein WBE77_07830, partial [Candidatus Cybelea sp.]
ETNRQNADATTQGFRIRVNALNRASITRFLDLGGFMSTGPNPNSPEPDQDPDNFEESPDPDDFGDDDELEDDDEQ